MNKVPRSPKSFLHEFPSGPFSLLPPTILFMTEILQDYSYPSMIQLIFYLKPTCLSKQNPVCINFRPLFTDSTISPKHFPSLPDKESSSASMSICIWHMPAGLMAVSGHSSADFIHLHGSLSRLLLNIQALD